MTFKYTPDFDVASRTYRIQSDFDNKVLTFIETLWGLPGAGGTPIMERAIQMSLRKTSTHEVRVTNYFQDCKVLLKTVVSVRTFAETDSPSAITNHVLVGGFEPSISWGSDTMSIFNSIIMEANKWMRVAAELGADQAHRLNDVEMDMQDRLNKAAGL
ncbi:hypothetical protein Peetri_00012 [Pseudomonas phage vB_PpuM-Peetri]